MLMLFLFTPVPETSGVGSYLGNDSRDNACHLVQGLLDGGKEIASSLNLASKPDVSGIFGKKSLVRQPTRITDGDLRAAGHQIGSSL